MNPIERFIKYAQAFEEAYREDEWTRLECFFDDRVTYTVSGDLFLAGRWEGRDAVIAHLREVITGFDKRFDERVLEAVGEPRVKGDTLSWDWKATYRSAGLPDIEISGTEVATFDGDQIVSLEDEMDPACVESIRQGLKQLSD